MLLRAYPREAVCVGLAHAAEKRSLCHSWLRKMAEGALSYPDDGIVCQVQK